MRAGLAATVAGLIASPSVRQAQRLAAAARRRITGARPVVRYFHQTDDPYSALSAAVLPALEARYEIILERHVVPPPDETAAPEPALLAAWSAHDAARLSRRLAIAPLADATAAGVPHDTPAARAAGANLRRRLGHYLGAMFHFEGEWCWGLDRLAYLEERLAPFRRRGVPPGLLAPRLEPAIGPPGAPVPGLTLEIFASLRSPYTYLAVARALALARAMGAQPVLRPVLPMVMRGLPVPVMKRLYIVRDCAREAERLAMPFGRIADPVGAPAERGLAVLHRAMALGKGEAFLLSFLKGVFAEGVDAGAHDGLARLALRAGLTPAQISDALKDNAWRAAAQTNREAMFAAGLWGVPSFRVIGPRGAWPAVWGQDRLWAVGDDLAAAAAQEAPP
jgi:2-hydroxychromene-2-carboxylate isomerase